jgi:Tol biopolymer transport system component
MHVNGSVDTQVVKTGFNRAPRWAPNGKHLLFLSDRSGSSSLLWIDIEKGKAAGLPHVLRNDIGNIRPIGVTRTGSYYYEQQGVASDGVNVFVADLDPVSGRLRGPATYLTERFAGWNNAPSWSPDGKLIAFKRRRVAAPHIFDLVVHTVESGEERVYTAPDWTNVNYGFGPGAPTWTRDSSGLFVGQEPTYDRRWIGRLDLRDGRFTKMVEVDKTVGWMCAVSPDDKTGYFLYSRDGTYLTVDGRTNLVRSSYGGIVAVDLTTGQRRDVLMIAGTDTVNSADASPDGRTLAFFVYEDAQGRRGTRLTRIETDGTNRRDLYAASKPTANVPDQVQWSNSGRSLFFIEDGRVMRIPVDGGPPEFTGLSLARPDRRHPISLSPDGSRIAFSDGAPWTASREVWALDNVLALMRSPR